MVTTVKAKPGKSLLRAGASSASADYPSRDASSASTVAGIGQADRLYCHSGAPYIQVVHSSRASDSIKPDQGKSHKALRFQGRPTIQGQNFRGSGRRDQSLSTRGL